MKNLILIMALILTLTACSGGSSGRKDAEPDSKDDSLTLEGTVVKIWNALIPSAHALTMPYPNLGEIDSPLSLPEAVIGMDCPYSRCAFLIKSGDSVGGIEEKKSIRVISVSPVIDGKFKFQMNAINNPLYEGNSGSGNNPMYEPSAIYKVVVRGWDNESKMPLNLSPSDREIVLSAQEMERHVGQPKYKNIKLKLFIDPESTIQSRRRVEVLKSNLSEENSGSFFQVLRDVFQEQNESVREMAKRLIQVMINSSSPEKELLEQIQLTPPQVLQSEVFLSLREEKALNLQLILNPLSSLSNEDLLARLDEINEHILAVRLIQRNLLAKYPARVMVRDAQEIYSQLSILEEMELTIEKEEEGSEELAQLMAQYKIQEAKILLMTLKFERDFRLHENYVKLENSINHLQSLKEEIDLDSESYSEISEQLGVKVKIPSLDKENLDEEELSLLLRMHSEAQDFNSSRSNKDKAR